MRIIKLIIASIIVLFSILTAIGLLFPSTVRVSRAVKIEASRDTVYKYMNDLKYWKLWMAGEDTGTIVFLKSKTEGAGTVIKMGTSEVSVKRSVNDSIYTYWKSAKGNVQQAVFIITAKGNSTDVQWYFEQHVDWYPWERLSSMMNDKILGPVMEESLNKLKSRLEG